MILLKNIMDLIITTCLVYYKYYLHVLYYLLFSSLYQWSINITENEYNILVKEKQNSVLWFVRFVKSIHNSKLNNNTYVLYVKSKYNIINKEIYYIMMMICRALYEQLVKNKWKHINNQINEITYQTSHMSPLEKIKLQQKIKENNDINKCNETIENVINSPLYQKNIKEKGLEQFDTLVKRYLNIVKTI